ncbi:hypothetical protein L484_004732 [Morus notabilis]|uniref:Uncharacterized protein n=1 Tax=Morus notabilis TaxID=981085 RepID=W9SIB6_9ROSA|nr:hypothetical protein L484_004732 [Morus notabilis]
MSICLCTNRCKLACVEVLCGGRNPLFSYFPVDIPSPPDSLRTVERTLVSPRSVGISPVSLSQGGGYILSHTKGRRGSTGRLVLSLVIKRTPSTMPTTLHSIKSTPLDGHKIPLLLHFASDCTYDSALRPRPHGIDSRSHPCSKDRFSSVSVQQIRKGRAGKPRKLFSLSARSQFKSNR